MELFYRKNGTWRESGKKLWKRNFLFYENV